MHLAEIDLTRIVLSERADDPHLKSCRVCQQKLAFLREFYREFDKTFQEPLHEGVRKFAERLANRSTPFTFRP